MKTTLALIFASCASLLLISCGNWPYKPAQFIAPVPPPPENAFVSKDSLTAFVGTHNVKLAYTKMIPGGTQLLYFVDFNDSLVSPKLLKRPSDKQDWAAWCPILSPDGALVTYYLVDPSNGKHAAAYCQKLDTGAVPNLIDDPGSEPHFYADNLNNIYITYADTTDKIDADYNTLKSRHTYKVQINKVTGQKTGTKTSIASFPFYGGMSYDGNYICTGYSNAYIFNTVSQSFFSVNTGKQTCNPSMTPDSLKSGQMMFLNIGGIQNMKNMPAEIGQSPGAGEHQYVFIADTANSLISSFSMAEILPNYSGGEWQCPKWSNASDYFCALATKSTESNVIVYDCFIVSISTKKALLLNVKPELLQFNSTSKPYVYLGGK
jgi:hypothetical protein